MAIHTTSGTDLDVEGSDAKLLAAGRNILSSQHGSVGRRLVTVGLDLHTTSDTADGFAAAGITHVSLGTIARVTNAGHRVSEPSPSRRVLTKFHCCSVRT